jgi:membrane-associated phospholipid phosphatase
MNTTKQSTILYQVATSLSYILHPASIALVTIMFLGICLHQSFYRILFDIIILLAGIFPGLLYIVVKTKKGQFSHYHLLLKSERRIMLPILLLGFILSLLLYIITGSSFRLMQYMLISLTGGIGFIIISLFWKISLHAAVAMGCAALLLSHSPVLAISVAVLGALTGVSRIVVHHHTVAQVTLGWIYGFGVIYWLLRLLP